ncbi:LysR family transcriptional regulator [Facklamia sp. DSM 111018]|uniref:LysR family transcriptional regulator n=1 Tax=Facklamia lactis TaxID=2749967 RepID=A0ABS0LN82_9LACT|nr:LysR family transcriptional regulator [Facklamia lactis]MBG9979752.1 LysR family transcriptional regulator [Facklamia lactis]MBG9985568.1 LysR family transcriptional regulator [Facklamia lactis]
MNLIHLNYFKAVCENDNNVSKAAKKLYVSQSTISASLKKLEDTLGIQLYERTNNNTLEITNEGKAIFLKTIQVLEQYDELLRTVSDLKHGEKHIRFGLPPMLSAMYLPMMYEMIVEKNLEILLSVSEELSPLCLKSIKNKNIDFALIAGLENEKFGVPFLKICETSLQLCTKSSDLNGCAALTMEELSDHPLIMLKQPSFITSYFNDLFAEKKLKPNIVLETNHLTSAIYLIKERKLNSILFKEIIEKEPELLGIPIQGIEKVSIYLVWNEESLYFDKLLDFKNNLINLLSKE